MNLDQLLDQGMGFYYQYPYAVAAIAVLLLIILYKKPKACFKLGLLLLVIAAFFYVVSLFMDTVSLGSNSTKQGIEKIRSQGD